MGAYLVVANETLLSPELKEVLVERAQQDSAASFVILVPATPPNYLVEHREGDPRELAQSRASGARNELEAMGLRIGRVAVGDASPMVSIREEIEKDPAYKGIIVGTHPSGISRWLQADVPAEAEKLGLPVTHVVVESVHKRHPNYRPRSPD
jgi:hypothetical protein